MKKYDLVLSMGHDTDSQVCFSTFAESRQEAYNKAAKTYLENFDKDFLKKIYKDKGVQYMPYVFFAVN